MNRIVSKLGSLLLVFLPVELNAQTSDFPEKLIGKWGRVSEMLNLPCSPKSLEQGVEIRSHGEIIVRDVPGEISVEPVRLTCLVTEYDLHSDLMRSLPDTWIVAGSYTATCDVKIGEGATHVVERMASLSLWKGTGDKTPTLIWSELRSSLPKGGEKTVFMKGHFKKCPLT